MSALNFSALLTTKDFEAGMNKIRSEIRSVSGVAEQETSKIDSSFRNVGAGIAAYFSGQALLGFTKQLINIRGEFQKTEIAFTTMLQSSDKAKVLMGQMVDLAAKTPFSLQDVSDGAKRLLAFQVPAEQVVETLTRIGNVAAGLSVPMGQLIHVYGQVKAQGRLMTNDLYQFMNAGIPMVAELAKVMGVAENEVKDLITEGKIGFPEVQQVIQNLTNEGGLFFNLMEEQSKSLSGQIANLGDSIDQMFNEIGEGNQGLLGDGISALNYLVENYKDVAEILIHLIAVYGAYRAALILTSLTQATMVTPIMLQGFANLIKLIRGATVAQTALNAASMANPYVALAVGIAAVVSALYYYKSSAEEAKTAAESLANSVDENMAQAGQETAELDKLYRAATNDKKSREEREAAVKKLQTQYPSYFANISSEIIMNGKAEASYYSLRDAIVASAKAKAAEKLIEEKTTEALRKKQKLLGERDAFIKDMKSSEDRIISTGEQDIVISGEEGRQKNRQKAIGKQLEIFAVDKQLEEDTKDLLDLVDETNKKTEKLRQDREKTAEQTQQTVAASTEKVKKQNKAQERELAEVFSENSIADLEQRISLWNEALKKASGDEVQELTKNKYGDTVKTGQTVTIDDALAEVEKLEIAKAAREKQIRNKSFDEEMSELERQWKVRYLMAETYGEETTKAMFPDLSGDSYFANIEARFKALEESMQGGTPTDAQMEQWEKLKVILDSLNGVKDPFTNFKDGLDNSLAGMSTHAEKIQFLKDELEKAPKDGGYFAEVNSRLSQAEKDYQDYFKNILQEQKTYEEKAAQISDEYAKAQQSTQYQNGSDSDRAAIDKHFKEQLSQITLEAFQNTDAWTSAFGDMEYTTMSALKRILAGLQAFKNSPQFKNLLPDELKAFNEAEQNIQDAIGKRNPFRGIIAGIKEYKDSTDDLSKSDSLRKIGEGLSEAHNIFNAAAEGVMALGDTFGGFDDATNDAIGNIVEIGGAALDFGKSLASGDIAGMIKAGIKLISSIGKALSGDQKKERQIKQQTAALRELEKVYDDLSKAIEKSLGEGSITASQQAIQNLKQQKAILEQMIRTESSKKKSDKGKIDGYKEQIEGINQSIEDMQQSMIDKVLNGTNAKGLADRLSDALIQAFQNGEDAAEAMGKTVDDILREMVANALKMKILEPAMQGVVDKMLQNMGFTEGPNGISGTFDGLTDAEREELQNMMSSAGQNYMDALGAYSDLFGEQAGNAQGLKGEIKGSITEKTAGALESQINAMRIIQVENHNVAKNSLLQLSQIELNTRPIAQIQKDIAELNAKTKNPLAGI